MERKFEPFKEDVITREFRELPVDDAISLKIAMKGYQIELGTGYVVKGYGEGLFMIKPAGRSQGRSLFFRREVAEKEDGTKYERLVVVLIYKKESQQVPARVLETARKRMEESRNGE